MLESEQALFRCFLSCASNYLEFGSGGSTVMATSLVSHSVCSVESSIDWVAKVEAACAAADGIRPNLLHADIGPVRDLGYPANENSKERWPIYHTSIWSQPGSTEADLCFVDGRFRVACFLQALLRCDARTIILIHDFATRPHYNIVRSFAREFARSETLSAFRRKADFDSGEAAACLERYRFDPN
jgi:hypothetical protein